MHGRQGADMNLSAVIESSIEPRLGYIEADEIKRGSEDLHSRGHVGLLDMFLCRMVGRFGYNRVELGVRRVGNARLAALLRLVL